MEQAMPKRGLIFFLLLLASFQSRAAEAVADTSKDRGTTLIPLFYYTPDTRFALGAAGVYYFRTQNSRDSLPRPRLSYVQGLADYTQNKQLDLWAVWSVFTNNEDYLLRGETRYRNFPDRFYGIGNSSSDEDMERYYYDLMSFKALFMKRYGRHLFAGLDYHLRREYNFEYYDDLNLVDGTVPGYQGGVGSAVGIVVTKDSRDNVVNAYKGQFFEFSSYFFNNAWGGTFNFTALNGLYNSYTELRPGWILATNSRINLNFGEVPFLDMAKAGGEEMLRGYAANRYRDHHFVGSQVELRMPLYRRFRAVAFAGLGEVFRQPAQVQWSNLKYSVGGGLRYAMNESERLNIRLDYGVGRGSSSFYFSVTEAF